MQKLTLILFSAADILFAPFVYPAAWLLKIIRMAGVHRLPWCMRSLLNCGVFPVRDHYYEPQFDYRQITSSLFAQDRPLPGIDWNSGDQLDILDTFQFSTELESIPFKKSAPLQFHFNNGTFESGDAEYWYQFIRSVKPNRIIEVGSGNSTLMAIKAIAKNTEQNSHYCCEHVCIEPYEMAWLENTGVTVIRKKLEDIEPGFFSILEENDILFIDSSHIIRPQGDVLFLYLELLPVLNKGVIVHIHDIFSPRNYPAEWLKERVRFWNEQYLLEAFLSHNSNWKILGALNFLHHNHYQQLHRIAPYLTPDREPGSFYMQKIR